MDILNEGVLTQHEPVTPLEFVTQIFSNPEDCSAKPGAAIQAQQFCQIVGSDELIILATFASRQILSTSIDQIRQQAECRAALDRGNSMDRNPLFTGVDGQQDLGIPPVINFSRILFDNLARGIDLLERRRVGFPIRCCTVRD